MKIVLEMELKEPFVNLDYRRLFVSYMKNMISLKYPVMYKTYYETPNSFKPFSFDTKLRNPKFSKDRIELENKNLIFTVITQDMNFGIDMFNGFLSLKNTSYPLSFENIMTLKKVGVYTHKDIKSEVVLIKMLQPLAVRYHTKEINRYFLFDEEGFAEAFSNSVNVQLERARLKKDNEILIVPYDPKKVVVKTMGGNIPANIGMYVLKGKIETLNYLYQSGMCSRRSAGFSVFEVVSQGGQG